MDITQLNPQQLEKASSMLKAMAHPVRISILGFLQKHDKLTVTEIHSKLGIEQSTTSHHLGILKDKGVLISERVGKNTFYSLRTSILSDVVNCVGKCASV